MLEVLLFVAAGLVVAAGFVGWWLKRRLARSAEAVRERQRAKRAAVLEQLESAEVEYVLGQIERRLEALGADDPDGYAQRRRLEGFRERIPRTLGSGFGPFDPSPVVRQAVDELRSRLSPKRIELKSNGELPEIHGDPELLRWSLDEMADNVVAHAGAWSAIRVTTGVEEGRFVLRFEDDGEGPDHGAAARLYGAFTPRSGSEGPGLGLFTIQSMLDRMDGSIVAEANAQGGLCHTIRVPAASLAGRGGRRARERDAG